MLWSIWRVPESSWFWFSRYGWCDSMGMIYDLPLPVNRNVWCGVWTFWYRGFQTRMVYLDYLACLRCAILVRNSWNARCFRFDGFLNWVLVGRWTRTIWAFPGWCLLWLCFKYLCQWLWNSGCYFCIRRYVASLPITCLEKMFRSLFL